MKVTVVRRIICLLMAAVMLSLSACSQAESGSKVSDEYTKGSDEKLNTAEASETADSGEDEDFTHDTEEDPEAHETEGTSAETGAEENNPTENNPTETDPTEEETEPETEPAPVEEDPNLRYESINKIVIRTVTNKEPTFDVVRPTKEGQLGASVINNEYVQATFRFCQEEEERYYSGKIRVRGNTSYGRYPYKIKLDEKAALIPGCSFETDEWILVRFLTLVMYFGYAAGDLCGMEFNMPAAPVELWMNDDAIPRIYILVPAVSIKNSQGVVKSDGIIFENDPYYWKPGTGKYFQTAHQRAYFAYTIKSPDADKVSDEKMNELKTLMDRIENLARYQDTSYVNLIDVDEFARWLLCRDLVGNCDGAGGNMYFYQNPGEKLEIGPLWDFDGGLLPYDDWSASRNNACFVFGHLFETKPFRDAYIAAWKEVSQTFYADFMEKLDLFMETYRKTYSADREEALPNDLSNIADQYILMKFWFQIRIAFIDTKLGLTTLEQNLIDVSDYQTFHGAHQYAIDSVSTSNGVTRIKGWAFVGDSGSNSNVVRIGVYKDGKVRLGIETQRLDIQELYSLNGSWVGFEVLVPEEFGTQICIVDLLHEQLFID